MFVEFKAIYDYEQDISIKATIIAPIFALSLKMDSECFAYVRGGAYRGTGKYRIEEAEFRRIRGLMMNYHKDTSGEVIERSEPYESNLEGIEV